jgi:hypothetical protein
MHFKGFDLSWHIFHRKGPPDGNPKKINVQFNMYSLDQKKVQVRLKKRRWEFLISLDLIEIFFEIRQF